MRGARRGLQRLSAGLLAGVCLGAVTAHAADGDWLLTPVDGNWNNGANWSSNPTVPDGTARFNVGSSVTSITFSAPITVQTIEFNNPIPAFTPLRFGSTSATKGTLTIGGTGVDLLLLPTVPTFTQSLLGQLIFTGSASASTNPAQANGRPRRQHHQHRQRVHDLQEQQHRRRRQHPKQQQSVPRRGNKCQDSSTAGNAKILNTNLGTTAFYNNSTAGSALIFNDNFGATAFKDISTGGAASIFNINSGATFFNDQSSGGPLAMPSGGALLRIINETGGFTIFTDTSTTSFAEITNRSNGGAAGVTEFRGNSHAGSATIMNGGAVGAGTLNFREKSYAFNAQITNNNGGQTNFYDTSSAGQDPAAGGGPIPAASAVITNNSGGQTNFYDHSTASVAFIINNNGEITHFHDQSTGFQVNITNNAGGQTIFDAGTNMDAPAIIVDNAVLTNNAGGSAFFRDQSTAGLGRLINNAGGVVDISGLTNPPG